MAKTFSTSENENTMNQVFETMARLVEQISEERHIESMEAYEIIRKILDSGCF